MQVGTKYHPHYTGFLLHRRAIIEANPVKIGFTSQEGCESSTKFSRKFYKNHTLKELATKCNVWPIFHFHGL
jgi:hypothetical protein